MTEQTHVPEPVTASPATATATVAPESVTGSTEGTSRANRGVWIRAFIYVIGFHIFAGFVMLLFFFGGRGR
ncbi:DUF6126 family protein [Streptacidiphilus sp. PAMC 29251]